MSLQDLLPLLFVIVLVGSSLLRRGRGTPPQRPRGEEGDRPGGPPPRPSAEEREHAETLERPEDGRGAEGRQGGGEPLDDLRSRLEEARRRVREAAGGAEATARPGESRRDRAPTPPLAGGGADRPATLGRPTQGRTGGTGAPQRGPSSSQGPHWGPLGPTGAPARPGTERPWERSGERSRDQGQAIDTAPPLQRRGASSARKTRRRKAHSGSAKLTAAEVLAFEREDIVRGFLWSVIFSDPVAHRRRKVSPRRLP